LQLVYRDFYLYLKIIFALEIGLIKSVRNSKIVVKVAVGLITDILDI